MKKNRISIDLSQHRKNSSLVDAWSFVHLLTGIALVFIVPPFFALVLMVLWEPLEVLVLSPLLAKRGILFGHESLRNSLSDIVFDVIGVSIGYLLFT